MSGSNIITHEVKFYSNETLERNAHVEGEIKCLIEITATINESMQEMSSETLKIERAVGAISQMEQINKQNIKKLEAKVKKFKI